MGPAAPGLCLLPAGARLPLNVLGKLRASEFISFPCTGSRWHRAPCPLVVNTAGSVPALEPLRPGARRFSAAVLGVLVLISFILQLFGAPRPGWSSNRGVLTPPSRQGPALGPVCVRYCRCRWQRFAARMRFSRSQRVQGAPSSVLLGCGSCFLSMKLGVWRETCSLRESLAGLQQGV